MYSIGIDVHQRFSNVCILDDRGNPIKETRVKTSALPAVVADVPAPRQVGFEASLGYGPLFDRLRPLAQRVVVAHPGQLRLIFRSKRKNDRVDARKLALLLHLDELPPVYVPAVDQRAWRRLIEARTRRVADRTRTKNRLRGLLRSAAVVGPRRLWTIQGLAWLQDLELPTADLALERDLLLEDLARQEAVVRRITTRLDEVAATQPGVRLLQTIPGVGPRTAEAIVAYIADPQRFRHSRQVGNYFGLTPSQDQSGNRNRLGHITREGPATARRLLTEAAWQALRRDAHVHAYFARIQRGDPGRKKIALVATAHYLVRCMQAMLRNGEEWRFKNQDKETPTAA